MCKLHELLAFYADEFLKFAVSTEKKLKFPAYIRGDSNMQDIEEAYINKVRSMLNKELIALLVAYAQRKILRCNFLAGGNITAKGKDAQDYVQDAIVTVIKGVEGKRRWDEKTDFQLHMKGIIRSQIGHSFELTESQKTQRESTISYFKADDEESYTLDSHPGSSPTPLDNAINADADRKMWEIMGLLEDDPLLKGIFQCIFDGTTKPSEIAEELKTTTKEINNGKKRLGRRLQEYRENQRKEAIS